jgi:hypothetical protein
MDRRSDERVLAVAKEIQNYLENHPNAADSADGVMRWWLSQQRLEESLQIVQQALEALVSQGEIDKAVTPGGRTVYSSAKEESMDKKQH